MMVIKNQCTECGIEIPANSQICWNCKAKTQENNSKLNESAEFTNEKECLRCHVPLDFVETIRMHEGTEWGIFGNLGHLFTNNVTLDMYICEKCRKVEFFAN